MVLTDKLHSQIGDLLAEISGEKSAPLPKTPASSGIKRKADDSNGDVAKITKARHTDGSASKITRNAQGDVVERSRSTSHLVKPAYTGTSAKRPSPQPHRTNIAPTSRRPSKPLVTNGSTTGGRSTAGLTSNSSQLKSTSDIASRPKLNPSSSASKVAPAKPSPTTPTASDPARAPKKGSFAEIMARGAKAQQVMGKVGVIQHKATEKPVVKKEREPTKPGAKTATGKQYLGNARPTVLPSRDVARSGGQGRDVQRNGGGRDGKQIGKQRPGSSGGDTQEKKVKKAATATTGYTGTARPPPNTANKPSSSRNGKPQGPSRAGGLLAPPKASRRGRFEEYDDDMADFIDYDDEDEPDPRGPGYGYGYESDGSSDMEAGLTDIDEEERRATFAAIREDKREQALEEKLKREKEERKRQLSQGRR